MNMDMSGPMGKMHPPLTPVELQQEAVEEMMREVVSGAEIVGHGTDDCTVYLLYLSPKSADTLAALYSDLEDGDPLDAGEMEHDGREPDPEDVR